MGVSNAPFFTGWLLERERAAVLTITYCLDHIDIWISGYTILATIDLFTLDFIMVHVSLTWGPQPLKLNPLISSP